MKVTNEHLQHAAKLGKEYGVGVIYVNDKGEYFTKQHLAALSVEGKKERYGEIKLTTAAESLTAKPAPELVAEIEKSDDKAAVEAMLAEEKEGKKRTTVLAALEKRIAELSKDE